MLIREKMKALIRPDWWCWWGFTFQNTESKSAPWNLSGIPAEEILGPSKVTNSSKPTWPSPDDTEEHTDMSLQDFMQQPEHSWSDPERETYHPCQVFGWWPPAPPHWACSPVSAWPSPAPASRWSRSHLGQIPWKPRESLLEERGRWSSEKFRESRDATANRQIQIYHFPTESNSWLSWTCWFIMCVWSVYSKTEK